MAAHLADRHLATLAGHSGAIHALIYSSGSGQYLLSGSSDRSINLYNPAKASNRSVDNVPTSSALIQSYTGVHGYEVLSLAVSADNSRFISGGGDKTVFLWDVATAKTQRRYGGGAGGHAGRIEGVAFAGDGDSLVVSGSFDSTVRFWDTKSAGNKPIMVLREGKDSISALDVRDCEIVTGCIDGKVRWYDVRMGMLSTDVIGQPITSVTLTQQSDSVLVSSLDSSLKLLDKTNGKLLAMYQDANYSNTTYRIRSTLAAKDSIVLSGGEDGWAYAWDIVTGECMQRFQHQRSTTPLRTSKLVVSAVATKGKSEEWASAGGDGSITIWG